MINGNEIRFKGITNIEKISITCLKGFKIGIEVKDIASSFKVDFKNMVVVHRDKSYEFVGMCINKNDNTELEFIIDLGTDLKESELNCEKEINQHIEEMLQTISKTI